MKKAKGEESVQNDLMTRVILKTENKRTVVSKRCSDIKTHTCCVA